MVIFRNAEDREELNEKFHEYVTEALAEASALIAERGKGYDFAMAAVDYYPHGTQDLIYELYKKLMRTKSAMLAEKAHRPVDGKVEDGILDSINYQAFLYAYRKMEKEGLI